MFVVYRDIVTLILLKGNVSFAPQIGRYITLASYVTLASC